MLKNMNATLLKGLAALVPIGLLLSGSAVLFLEARPCGLYYSYSAQHAWWWSSLRISARHFICFLRCNGALSIALVITSISGVLCLV